MGNIFSNNMKTFIPKSLRTLILRQLIYPRIGKVKAYDFFSAKPISSKWGEDRGTPIDRYYIEKFLFENAELVRGRVLEIGDNYYTIKYGGNKVTVSEILHADNDNPKATYIGSLVDIPQIPSDYFDCIICTQTLQVIPELECAINTLYRVLKNGGVLLVTVPGISQIYYDTKDRWHDYWRFTKNLALMFFRKSFNQENIHVEAYGNVLSSISFLHGLAMEELTNEQLDYHDENYQMLISVKAVK